jgi:hypothetical protein
MTAPPTDGQGAYLSMKRALQHANKAPVDVAYINAHATSTPLGDRAENRAIRRLMCEDGGVESKKVRVSSSKGAIGHLLGAAGSVEAIFSILALHYVSCLFDEKAYCRAFYLQLSILRDMTKKVETNGIAITLRTRLKRLIYKLKGEV